MSPKITISVGGEKVAEVDLSKRDSSNLLQALEDHSVNRLINPKTRMPYNKADQEKNIELRRAVIVSEDRERQTS